VKRRGRDLNPRFCETCSKWISLACNRQVNCEDTLAANSALVPSSNAGNSRSGLAVAQRRIESWGAALTEIPG
jgi:hypothetical protein